MKTFFTATILLAVALFAPALAKADPLTTYVGEFKVSSPDNAGLKTTLQTLLASRISGDGIALVDAETGADLVVTGTYTQIGKVFSLDANARAKGKVVASAFEQGESQDVLIPAIGKIAAKLKSEMVKQQSLTTVALPAAKKQRSPSPASHQEELYLWVSPRIQGVQSSLAPGVSAAEGKEFVYTDANVIRLCRQEKTLRLLAEEKIPQRMKIVTVDTLNGMAFVSIIDGEVPASRVYSITGDKLRLVAQDLPYLFRALALKGGEKRLYAQQMGRQDDFHGDVYEAIFEQGKLQLKQPIKMPRFANIFNFNRIDDSEGRSYTLAFSESGYLIVYSDQGEELWRSTQKLGGSETFLERFEPENERSTGSAYRKRFIDQRIVVTERGEVVVPDNDGTVIGTLRSYSKYSLVAFTWNGSSLEERWRSKLSENYLADYYYEPLSREMVLLEVIQKEGFFGKGGSAVKMTQLP